METIETPLSSATQLPIIKALYYNGLMTCLEISKVTHSSIPNVAKNISELVAAGYVEEKGLASSKGGRKPLTYSLIAHKRYIVSIAIDQFYTRMCIVDLHNKFVTEVEGFATDLRQRSCLDLIVNRINSMIENSGIPQSLICCAGISMPGFVDVDKGVNHTFLKVEADSLRDYLTEKINVPVFIDNDSSAIALAELKFGSGRKKKEIMVVNLGWGIGLGMIVNGAIFRGFSGFAGEFSHIPLFNNKKRCSCGKLGCLETEASLIKIEAKAIQAIKAGEHTNMKLDGEGKIAISTILKEATEGDLLAIKLISENAYHIGRGIAVLIHIMNPQLVVLSGKGIVAGKIWLAPIQQAINELCIPTLTQGVEVGLSSLGSNAQLIGSAALAIDKLQLNNLIITDN